MQLLKNSEDNVKLQKSCEVYLRALFSIICRLKDLVAQKNITQKELRSYVSLSNTLKEQLKNLGVDSIDLEEHKADTQQLSKDTKKHKKYLHLLKFRKSAIAVCAANRLRKLAKSRVSKAFGFIQILPGTQFPEGELAEFIKKTIRELPNDWNLTEEHNLITKTLKETSRLYSQGETNLLKSPLLVDILREGLIEIGSKYSWLSLGVPLELQTSGIEYVDKIFYKDLMSQEHAKRIEKGLNQIRLIPKLIIELESYKDQESTLLKQLQELQTITKQYEDKIEQLTDALKLREQNSVSKEVYDNIKNELKGREGEIKVLTKDLVSCM